jgi:hypothetical protein
LARSFVRYRSPAGGCAVCPGQVGSGSPRASAHVQVKTKADDQMEDPSLPSNIRQYPRQALDQDVAVLSNVPADPLFKKDVFHPLFGKADQAMNGLRTVSRSGKTTRTAREAARESVSGQTTNTRAAGSLSPALELALIQGLLLRELPVLVWHTSGPSVGPVICSARRLRCLIQATAPSIMSPCLRHSIVFELRRA